MTPKPRALGAAFKAKVALRGDKTTPQSSAEFKAHTNQVTAWKKHLLEQIGRLKIEVQRSRESAQLA